MKPVIGVTSGYEPGEITDGWPVIMTPKSLIERLERAGAVPVVLPVTEDVSVHEHTVGLLHGLVASGEIWSINKNVFNSGADDILESSNPLRYRNEKAVLTAALRRGLPILGICRGYQMLNVLEGGRVANYDIHTKTAVLHQQKFVLPPGQTVHEVRIAPGSRLHRMLGKERIMVNSFHRQAVLQVPEGYAASAISEDGWIEAIEAKDGRWIVGVQFHPEILPDPVWDVLFERFVEEAGRMMIK